MRDKEEIRYMLFVISESPKSRIAHTNLAKICDESQIQTIDIGKDPAKAMQYGILATPTVIRSSDSLTIVGTMSDLERTANLLGLPYRP